MRSCFVVTVSALAAVLIGGSRHSAQSARMQVAPLNQVAWLAGCWVRTSAARVVEEQWMRPRGGSMLGMARTTRGDSTIEWEHLRIADERGTLVYHAMPSGQPAAAFRAISVNGEAVVFENLSHDFPQRVIYRHVLPDSLHARIEGTMGGNPRSADFRYRRATCPA